MKPEGVISIAAYDPSGGAGIGADMKVFACLGVQGAGVMTALAPQTSKNGVLELFPIPTDLLQKELEAVHQELNPRAYKIGAVGSLDNAKKIHDMLQGYEGPIINDPVFSASCGGTLIDDTSPREVADLLFPISTMVTPNTEELSILTGRDISIPSEVVSALNELSEMYNTDFLATGVRWPDNIIGDIFLYKGQIRELKRKAVTESERTWHGLGCALSSAIAVYTTFGLDMFKSILKARYFVYNLLQASREEDWLLRHGLCQSRAENALEAMNITSNALRKLSQIKGFEYFVPEVGINIAFIPWGGADSVEEVIGLSSRIVKGPQGPLITGQPCLGGSSHVARLVLEINRRWPNIRAGMNISFCEEIVDAARGLGLRVEAVERRDEPPQQRGKEGTTLGWIAQSLQDGEPPHLIYDRGDIGKEPMVRILGENIFRVLEIVEELANSLR